MLTENCPKGRCVPGSGVVYITCDLFYQLSEHGGHLICAGNNRFTTPNPTCQGKLVIQVFSNLPNMDNLRYIFQIYDAGYLGKSEYLHNITPSSPM